MAGGDLDTQEQRRQGGGGWAALPFVLGAVAGLTLAGAGCFTNLIVYLIQEFNVGSINAAQIYNVVNGCMNVFPVAGAVIADSFLGCFSVTTIASCISLLGIVFMTLTATVDSLSPKHCGLDCQVPKSVQIAILYIGIALATMGQGGTRFTLATVGANQFHKERERATFFNWYFFMLYAASVVGATAMVYIEESISWGLGFGMCVIANITGLATLVMGRGVYRRVKVCGSPFADLARVLLAAVRKRKLEISSKMEDYHFGEGEAMVLPGKSLRFLNRAAMKTEEDDTKADGSAAEAKPISSWRRCTVQQVEDLKLLFRLFPLWTSSILLGTPIAIQASVSVLQVLTMNRHLGLNFKIPAGSIQVVVFLSCLVALPFIDRLLLPVCQKLFGKNPTPLQRVGMGHLLNIASLAVSALVEIKRLRIARSHHHHHGSNLGALWLLPQLALVGLGEAFHFPGQVALYFQEFPLSLKSTSTALISLLVAISFYLGAAMIDLLRKSTAWLPDDINQGRVDNIYWVLFTVGTLNFGYYMLCCKLYDYRNVEQEGANDGT